MRNSSRVKWLLFTLLAMGAGSAPAVAGCSSDGPAGQPNLDGSPDGTLPRQDAQGDGDANGSISDGSSQDAGTDAYDAGLDAQDAATDAQTDSGPKFDAGPPAFATYSTQIVHLWCKKLASCCGGDPRSFNLAQCESDYGPPSVHVGMVGAFAPYLFAGGNDHIAWDPAKAQKCFDDINALQCGPMSAETFKRMHGDCLAAVPGNIELGESGCRGSPECAPPNHCDKNGGTATGVCAAPRGLDARCDLGVWEQDGGPRDGGEYFEPQAQCGHLVTGNPHYCANADTHAGFASGKQNCATPSPSGASCYHDVECASRICTFGTNATGTCVDSEVVGSEKTCASYRLP